MAIDFGKISGIILSGAVGGIVALSGLWIMKPFSPSGNFKARAEVIRPLSVGNVDGEVRTLRVGRSSDLSFHILGIVNKAPIGFLVDTGANITVLTRDDAKRAGIPDIDTGDRVIVTGINRTLSSYRNVGRYSISLGPIGLSEVPLAVDDSGELANSILGQDAYCNVERITIHNNMLEFRHNAPVVPGCIANQ